jgi:hypothetical protein
MVNAGIQRVMLKHRRQFHIDGLGNQQVAALRISGASIGCDLAEIIQQDAPPEITRELQGGLKLHFYKFNCRIKY